MIGSYSSIFNMGHRAVADLLNHPVLVEEKVDGSQFSFGVFWENHVSEGWPGGVDELTLCIRSKGAPIYVEAPPELFRGAVDTVKGLHAEGKLRVGWTYRGEALQKPKHNALTYDRIPNGHIILFDITREDRSYLSWEVKAYEANRLGLEVVPLLYSGMVSSVEQFRTYLDRESILGGQKIEGVVIKPLRYDLYGVDKKVLMSKYVSEHFREVHKQTWGESNPGRGDVIDKLIQEMSSPARYQKAVIHLKERGVITEDTVKNIGPIIKEVQTDITKEERDYIAEKLWAHFGKEIVRRASSGVPSWYKSELLKQQFEPKTEFSFDTITREDLNPGWVVGDVDPADAILPADLYGQGLTEDEHRG